MQGFKHVAPRHGAVLADKIYSDGSAKRELARRGLHSMVIKKNNAKSEARSKYAFFSKLRMPFEGLFSNVSHRARYCGRWKVYFQVLMEAIISNLKRLVNNNCNNNQQQ